MEIAQPRVCWNLEAVGTLCVPYLQNTVYVKGYVKIYGICNI